MGTRSAWTAERRARQSQLIRQWRPWEQSTGPISDSGKARSSRNAVRRTLPVELEAMWAEAALAADTFAYLMKRDGVRPFSGEVLPPTAHSKLEEELQRLIDRGAFTPEEWRGDPLGLEAVIDTMLETVPQGVLHDARNDG